MLIRIFHSDCRWICRLTTPLLITTISKYHLEIDTLNDSFLWRIKSEICAAGKNTFTTHSKITDIGEGVVSLHFHTIAFTIVQLKGHRQVSLFRNESIVAKVSHGCHFSITVLSVDSKKWLNYQNRRGFFVFLNPPELNKNYPIRPEVATTLELFESFVVILNMKKANDEVTHTISSHSINIICQMLTLFSTMFVIEI